MLSLMRDLKRGLCFFIFFFFFFPIEFFFLTPCKHKRYNCITVESSLLMHPPSLDNLHLSTKALLLCACECVCGPVLTHAHCHVPLAQCYCHNPTPSPLSFSFLFFMRNGKEVWNTELYFTCLKMTLLHKLIYYGELYLFVWPHH